MSFDEFAPAVEQILQKAGLNPEREPEWLPDGTKTPDFFCPRDPPIWVEAKRLEATREWTSLRRLGDDLMRRAKGLSGTGTAHAYISPTADAGSLKRVFDLVRHARDVLRAGRCVVTIHGTASPRPPVEFTFHHDSEVIRYVSDEVSDGKFGIPYAVPPDSWTELVTVRHSDGKTREAPLYQVACEDAFLVALEISPSIDRFRVSMVTHAVGMQESKVKKRLRAHLRTANRQFKEARRSVDGPTLVVVGDTGQIPDTIEQDDILEALFGDLTVPFPIGDEKAPPPFYGQNGIWREQQHTSTSAVCWVQDGQPILTVHNPWADTALPDGLLPGRELKVNDDGRLYDCSNDPA